MLKSKSTYKYLDFVKFSQLYNWSVQYLNDSKIRFTTKYPLVQIKEFLTRNKTAITVQDEITYQRVTIRVRNGGVIPRDEIKGTEIGTKKQFLISAGQFIFSKIDARNGAMGIIPEKLNGAIVTQDFLAYDIDTTKINPQYLVLVSTTKQFIDFCQSCSSGTTNRQRVDEDKFLNIQIPLPSLAEQNKLVEEYNEQLTLSENVAGNAELKQSNINKIILECLGVKIVKSNLSKGLSFVSFAELDRWDLSFLQNDAHVKSSYNLVRIADCVDQFMTDEYGYSLRTETSKYPAKKFYYIGMEHIEKSAGELIDMPVVNGAQIKSQTISVPKGYFIYGKLRPYLNKYWYNNTDVKDIICSSELFVFSIKKNIHPRYFEFVLGSDIVQSQISDLVSGARMPRINEKIFMNIQIPLPPINVQEDIVEQIEYNKKEIKSLQLTAATYKVHALTNFESQIFE
jgi:type I restriction-modification system specificity determinant